MPFDSEGKFRRKHSWEDDRLSGISIDSSRMDEDTDDIADALSQCMLRSGNQKMTGPLNMNNYKIQNLTDGTAQGDAVNKSQLDAQSTSLTTAYQSYVSSYVNSNVSSKFKVVTSLPGNPDANTFYFIAE